MTWIDDETVAFNYLNTNIKINITEIMDEDTDDIKLDELVNEIVKKYCQIDLI